MKAQLSSLLMAAGTILASMSGGVARADDLNLGGPYNTFTYYENGFPQSEGAGSIANSGLNGKPLEFLYCVDLFHDISVPGDYNQTTVSTTGYVNGSKVNNAGEVAWLLDHFAVSAESSANAQIALQAAIWHVMYGTYYYLDPFASAYNQYKSDLSALGSNTDPVSNVAWFTPGIKNNCGTYQGLVGPMTPVPEPMSICLLGALLLIVLPRIRRHRAMTKA